MRHPRARSGERSVGCPSGSPSPRAREPTRERFTVSIDEPLAEAFDGWLQERGCATRSEGFRDLLRAELERRRQRSGRSRHRVASLSYVCNHHERDLAGRLTGLPPDNHPLVIASTHVHLDHDQCLET